MADLRFFFTDYCEDKSIPSEKAVVRTKDEIRHSMDCVLHVAGNFCGIIDQQDVTLQFMVNENLSVHVDIPVPAKRGSFTKTTTVKECLDLVSELGDAIQPESIPGLALESW